MSAEASAVSGYAVCAGCGCLCDDIAVGAGAPGASLERACTLGVAWFRARIVPPAVPAYVDGRPADLDGALEAAAACLAGARAPLLYGFADASNEAQAAAVELADTLGAALDAPAAEAAAAWTLAVQRRGVRSATLAEVKNRADLVVLWETAPEETHPRFIERFVRVDGLYASRSRRVLWVGEAGAPVSKEADRTIAWPRGRGLEVLWALRAQVRGRGLADGAEAALGLEPGALAAWAAELTAGRYGVWVYDAERPGVDLAYAQAVLGLVEALDERIPYAAVGLRGAGNPLGAENVWTSRTGYPFALDFAAGFPRFEPGPGSGAARLARGAVDALLLVTPPDAPGAWPDAVRRAVARVPTVVVDVRDSEFARAARAAIFVAPPATGAAATLTRMDGITLRAQPPWPDARPGDAAVLRRLTRRVAALRGGSGG